MSVYVVHRLARSIPSAGPDAPAPGHVCHSAHRGHGCQEGRVGHVGRRNLRINRGRWQALVLSALVPVLAGAGNVAGQERRVLEPVMEDARTTSPEWLFTVSAPEAGWQELEFDETGWSSGYGAFGSPGVEGVRIGTEWTGGEIWLRRKFAWTPGRYEELILSLRHDDDAEVYINGRLVHQESGFTGTYAEIALGGDILEGLREGLNTVAVHCANTGGPGFLDAGLQGSRTVKVTLLAADARIQAGEWKFTASDPGPGWNGEGFDDGAWSSGPGGFGSAEVYDGQVGSAWLEPDIWLRRAFTADRAFPEVLLTYHHDDDLEVHLNGKPVLQHGGFTTGYQELILSGEEAGILAGENILAVHCRNAGSGPQFVDVGLLGLESAVPTGVRSVRRSPGARAAMRPRPTLVARGGWMSLAGPPSFGAASARGRLLIHALDGTPRASLDIAKGAAGLALPAILGAGTYRFSWKSGGDGSEGILINLP